MNLHTLKPAKGATHKEKRIGRGEASGKGGTSTKGNKGGQSRAGYKSKKAHEGGQMPIQRRVPKRGFTNVNRKVFAIVNVEALNCFANGEVVDYASLVKRGLVKKELTGLKILGDGELKVSLTVKANKFSKSAEKSIVDAGGKIEVI